MPNRIWHHSVSCLHYFRVIAIRKMQVAKNGSAWVRARLLHGWTRDRHHRRLFCRPLALNAFRRAILPPTWATQSKSISCCRGPSKGARASDALLSGGKAVFRKGNQTAIPYQVGLSPSSSSSSCCPSSSSSSSSAAAAPFLFPSACAFLPRC